MTPDSIGLNFIDVYDPSTWYDSSNASIYFCSPILVHIFFNFLQKNHKNSKIIFNLLGNPKEENRTSLDGTRQYKSRRGLWGARRPTESNGWLYFEKDARLRQQSQLLRLFSCRTVSNKHLRRLLLRLVSRAYRRHKPAFGQTLASLPAAEAWPPTADHGNVVERPKNSEGPRPLNHVPLLSHTGSCFMFPMFLLENIRSSKRIPKICSVIGQLPTRGQLSLRNWWRMDRRRRRWRRRLRQFFFVNIFMLRSSNLFLSFRTFFKIGVAVTIRPAKNSKLTFEKLRPPAPNMTLLSYLEQWRCPLPTPQWQKTRALPTKASTTLTTPDPKTVQIDSGSQLYLNFLFA